MTIVLVTESAMQTGFSFHDEMNHEKWPLYKWCLAQKKYSLARQIRQEIRDDLSSLFDKAG